MNIVNTYGTATPRYTTSLHVHRSDTLVDLPIGACIARWDIKQQQRHWIIRAHSDVVTFIGVCPTNDNLIATTAYCGEVRLWNSQWQPVCDQINIGNEKLNHTVWSPDGKYLLLCSEGGEGLLTILQVNQEQDKYSLTVATQVKGFYEYACFDREVQHVLAIWQQRRIKDHGSKSVLFQVNQNNGVISLDEKDSMVLQSDGPQVTVVHHDETCDHLAVAFQDRSVAVLKTNSLHQVARFKPETASHIKCMLFEESSILLRTKRGFGRWLIAENQEPKLVDDYNIPSVSGNIFYIGYKHAKSNNSREDRAVWIASDSQMHSVDLNTPETNSYSINFHNLTCCGVDFSPDGKYVVSGDFSGDVMLWEVDPNVHKPLLVCNVGMSIRALCCREYGNQLYIYAGTLDGCLFRWKVNVADKTCEMAEKVLSMCDTITVIKWQHGQDSRLMALGTSDGMLCIVEQMEDVMRIKLAIVAHKPIKENTDNRFGSIAKYSEVWSLAWSPCNQFVATCSEDQTTCIWNMYGEKMHMLTGHTTAVTSVEWRSVPKIGELMVTCADDRTVMLWKLNTQSAQNVLHTHSHHADQIEPLDERNEMENTKVHIVDNKNRWGLFHIFKTEGYGLDWHTITYLALDKQGTKLACATQNGYMFVWDISTLQLLARGKMHNGSIEGLSWCHANQYFASVSSDCTINIYEVTK
jgi:WD40 repeat protein